MKPFQYLSPIQEFEYLKPRTLDEALSIVSKFNGVAKVIAGGTDLTIALKELLVKPQAVVDINGLKEIRYIRDDGGIIRIGALTTFDEIYRSGLINKYARCLAQAAYNVGTWQIRNLATLGGNIANASPAADGATPLISLDAHVHIKSINNERDVPIIDMFLGPKKSALNSNELITEVYFKKDELANCGWARIGRRNANTISVVNVAVNISLADGKYRAARIGLGSVGPTPLYAKKASEYLIGKEASSATISQAAKIAMDESNPISDIRGTKIYRLSMVKYLTEKLLNNLTYGGIN
ncbi:MAG: xanthine dehydrogenase family protein subunit M [Conexivisphaerales archaeon]